MSLNLQEDNLCQLTFMTSYMTVLCNTFIVRLNLVYARGTYKCLVTKCELVNICTMSCRDRNLLVFVIILLIIKRSVSSDFLFNCGKVKGGSATRSKC